MGNQHTLRRIALGAAFALTVASCGSNVDRSVFEVGAGADDGSSGGFTSGGSSSGGSPGSSGAAGSSGSSGSSGSGGSTGAGTPTPGATGGSSPATQPAGGAATPAAGGGDAPAPGTDGADAGAGGGEAAPTGGAATPNYDSDVGVTATSIKLGNITTVGGPMPGQFEPWLLGVRTWVNEMNEKGGLNGRKIEFLPCDDAMDAERNRQCAKDLIENQKVFAIVGTNTPAMPSDQYINDKKVPAVGVAAIGNYTAQLPYWFGGAGMKICPRNGVTQSGAEGYCASNTVKASNASYKFYKDTVGAKKAAVFWHNIDISKQAGLDQAHALESTGIEVVYTAETQVAEPDYTGHVLQMRDRGVELILDAMEINNNIRLMQAMDRQGFLPKAKGGTVATFGQEIREQVSGPSVNTLFIPSTSRPYTDLQNPAVAQFAQRFETYFGDTNKHQWNIDGYHGAKLFEAAASSLGADLTREGLKQWLDSVQDFDSGLNIPMDFQYYGDAYYQQAQPEPTCLAFVKFEGDDYYKVTPGSEDSIQCIQGDWVEPRSR